MREAKFRRNGIFFFSNVVNMVCMIEMTENVE